MEACKICELEGVKAEFKDGRGLGIHLRTKHNGIQLEKYRQLFGEVNEEKIRDVEKDIPETDEDEEEQEQENVVAEIKDFILLNENINLSAMFVTEKGIINSFRPVIAIGKVEGAGNSVISALIIGDDGLLTPPFMVPNFMRIVENGKERNKQIPKKPKGKDWKKFKGLFKKSKKLPTEYQREWKEGELSNELTMEFSKFLETKRNNQK